MKASLFLTPALCILVMNISLGLCAQDLPVDKEATLETVHLYQNLKKIADKGFLFGHQDDLAYGVGWKYEAGRSDIKDVTGDYPAVYGWELGRIELDHPVNLDSVPFDRMRQWIREGYQRGGVITLSWHLNNPLTGGTAWQPAPGTVASILPGGEKNRLYKDWLDKVAAFMLSLKGQKGEYIPVVFRIFHELNGSWFWWGGKNCRPDELKALWQFTVSYLRDERKVHNLLYAYNTDRFTSVDDWLDRYPGDQWADVAGFDIYQGNTIASSEAFVNEFGKTLTMIEKIAADHHKIAAVTEFGFNGLTDPKWWTNSFLSSMKGHRISYVMAWRNAGQKQNGQREFYVPYKGQESADDFIQFYKQKETLFQKEAGGLKLYQ